MIKITRSFSRKLNLGNFQTADFYCSRELEVENKDATQTSKNLHDLCELDVMDSIEKYLTPKPCDTKLGEKFQEEYAKRSEIDEINKGL
jgi:hypothetical protein